MLSKDEKDSDNLYDFIEDVSDVRKYNWWVLVILLLPITAIGWILLYIANRLMLDCIAYVQLIQQKHSRDYAFRESFDVYSSVYDMLAKTNSTGHYKGAYEYLMFLGIIIAVVVIAVVGAVSIYNARIEHKIINDVLAACKEDQLRSFINDEIPKKIIISKYLKYKKQLQHKVPLRIDPTTLTLSILAVLVSVAICVSYFLAIPKSSLTGVDFATFSEYAQDRVKYLTDDEYRQSIDSMEFFE